jgi:FlaA1/EpsC-like NDP-sugar epimerase
LTMLNDKTVLITGGTGSFGKKFIETILARYSNVKKIIEQSVKAVSEQFADKHHALFLGRGDLYPVAMEGALKLK